MPTIFIDDLTVRLVSDTQNTFNPTYAFGVKGREGVLALRDTQTGDLLLPFDAEGNVLATPGRRYQVVSVVSSFSPKQTPPQQQIPMRTQTQTLTPNPHESPLKEQNGTSHADRKRPRPPNETAPIEKEGPAPTNGTAADAAQRKERNNRRNARRGQMPLASSPQQAPAASSPALSPKPVPLPPSTAKVPPPVTVIPISTPSAASGSGKGRSQRKPPTETSSSDEDELPVAVWHVRQREEQNPPENRHNSPNRQEKGGKAGNRPPPRLPYKDTSSDSD